MSQHNNRISYIYNPANQTYEELMNNFVIRKKEFNKIVRELQDSDLETSAQHFLIEGQRGTGKTSLLLRLKYEIENNEELSNLISVQFAEEQYNIFDLCRIWEHVAEFLEDTQGFEELSQELDNRSEDDDYTTECFYIVERYLKQNNKRLVLLLDNFGDILDKLSELEQMRLRDIFHSSNYIQLIAASSRVLEHTYKHDKPFFEFFKIIKLEGLNKEDTNILLTQLAKTVDKDIEDIIQNQANRIETIRRLTGGIPRTIVLLFEIFLDDSANVFEDLEMILDRVTPLYKHRMDDLPKQQQAIMDTIALNWDGITAKEIVDGLKKRGFDTKKVSSQLNLLEKNDLILSRNIDKKNKLYMVKERFFNIWYLMRYGRKKNKTQVLWLVKFLQEWCNKEELASRAKKHIACAKDGNLHPKGGEFMAEALATLIEEQELQHELLIETKKALIKYNPNIEKTLSESDIEIFAKFFELLIEKKFEKAIKYLQRKQHKNGEDYAFLGLSYMLLKDFDNAGKYLRIATEKKEPFIFAVLSYMIWRYNIKEFQKKSIELAEEVMKFEKSTVHKITYANVLVWNQEYIKAVDILKGIIVENEKDDIEYFIDVLIFLLAKQQYQLTYNLFQEYPDLKNQLKPVYYALMTLLKDKYPKEYLKMGDELKETVDEILKEVEIMAEKYSD